MNSYSENLRGSTLSILASQEITMKRFQSEVKAAEFQRYFAEGNLITSFSKLESASKEQEQKFNLYEEAQHCGSISINAMATAKEANTKAAQAVTDTAVCAANVQVASNAILRLAADLGSIFSMIASADLGSKIYEQAENVKKIMDKTTYDCEVLSLSAMVASGNIADNTAAIVKQKSTEANAELHKFTANLSKDYESKTEAVSVCNETFVASRENEQKADGLYARTELEAEACRVAYFHANELLNLNLAVANVGTDSFSISFKLLKSGLESGFNKPQEYIRGLNILLVKNEKKSTFSLATAQELLNIQNCFYPISVPQGEREGMTISIPVDELRDSDNEAIQWGLDYVVFLMVNFTEDYKKMLNNLDDYLSAPSLFFKITPIVQPPNPQSFSAEQAAFQFEMPQSANAILAIEYRCMFIPADAGISFTTDLAAQVRRGNFGLPKKSESDKTKDTYCLNFEADTTDNFGNRLLTDHEYIPVVLAIAKEAVKNQHLLAMSNYEQTASFVFNNVRNH